MNGNGALKLISEIGVGVLGGFDGCACTAFSVQGVNVDVSCRKSGKYIRVSSRHDDAFRADLQMIANEVERQIMEFDPTPLAINIVGCASAYGE